MRKGRSLPYLALTCVCRWEIANMLQGNVHRRRHSGSFRDEALAAVSLFSIAIDRGSENQAWFGTRVLAGRITA